MRYRLAALMLLAVLSVMNVLAAPVLDPWAILAIGPSPDPSVADEQYRKNQREAQTCNIQLIRVFRDPEVQKLPSITRMKNPLSWLAENVRITPEDEGRRLRFKFRAGSRAEQVTILNAFLRAHLAAHEGTIKWGEECLRIHERNVLDLEKRIPSTKDPQRAARYQKALDWLRSVGMPETRAAIAREKQTAVVKWAE